MRGKLKGRRMAAIVSCSSLHPQWVVVNICTTGKQVFAGKQGLNQLQGEAVLTGTATIII
jgi:hypothetical protein